MSERAYRRGKPIGAAMTTMIVSLVSLAGCVSDGPPQRPAPASSVPAQPDGLTVNRVVFTVAQVLEDRDRNGYYDTIPATVYLFDTKYPYSIAVPGTFEFVLTEPASGRAIASWSVTWETASKAQANTWTGTIFPFQLDLREAKHGESLNVPKGTDSTPTFVGDRLPTSEVLIGCTFVPKGEAKGIECGSRLTVLIGKTR